VRKFLKISILFLSISFSGYCQILDDSTQQLYSSKTTQYYTQQDVLYNTNHKNNVDTSLLNLHNYNYYFKNNILYQDLGNLGTPLNRIYYEPPTTIGKNFGINTLTEYGYSSDNMKYYDTKSPFTKLFYIQGSRGQQSLEVTHTQNIKPNWNVGFMLKRMVSTKQIAGGVAGKELQMSHYSFAAHTSYTNKDKRYTFLFNVTHLDHQQYETGGILVDSANEPKKDMFKYKLEKAQLYSLPNSTSRSTHLRSYTKSTNFRFYNEYSINPKKAIQVYHQFDYSTITVRYDDDYLYDPYGVNYNKKYYPATTFDTLSTNNRTFSELYENKIGIKGSAAKLFYMGYFRRKDFSYIQNYPNFINAKTKFSENFVGGKADYRFTDTTIISVKAEYYLGRDYLFNADFFSKYIQAGYNKIFYSPTLFQLQNVGNNYQWQNNFSNTMTDYLYVKGTLQLKNFLFSPFANYTNINHLIYYDTTALPVQSNKVVQMTTLGFTARINYHVLYLENYLRYTKVSGADILRVPELFNQAKIYVYGPLFKHALRLQLGVDLSWKSGYYGMAYSPGTQQFTLSSRSNNFDYLDGYLLADVFLNTQIKRAFIFLKLSNATMGLPTAGYFITPYYTGMPRSFEFGIKWMFYD
ncbi:MAG TPA: putative porin, partial [Cytophagaceae bacterium]|jgi:hypothetical protein|nr:putative porin [Cytophagaceae bacterium]